MAAKYWLVTRSTVAAAPRINGVDAMVVVAETSGDALAIAKSKNDGDTNAVWATATELAATANLDGWTCRVRVVSPLGVDKADVTVVGVSSATLDTIGALAVIALNATAAIAGAAYSSNVLKVAETTDTLGDHSVYVTFAPPAASFANPIHIPGMIGAITHEGAGGAALTVAFAADGYTVPTVVSSLKQ